MVLKIIILALMAIFYICYFVKMIEQKRQGICTDQLGRGKTGLVKFIEIALKTGSCVLPVIQVISIICSDGNLHISVKITGVVIMSIGVAVFIAAVLQMRDNWRAGVQKEDKTELVTSGIYSVSRNPAFLGFDLMNIGILLLCFNWCLSLATIAVIVLFHLQIVNVEEDFLTEAFGDEYIQYKKSVCRYFGRRIKHGKE